MSASIFPCLLSVSPFLSRIRTLGIGFGTHVVVQDDLMSRSLLTSAKTLYPNKVPFPGSWSGRIFSGRTTIQCPEMLLIFWASLALCPHLCPRLTTHRGVSVSTSTQPGGLASPISQSIVPRTPAEQRPVAMEGQWPPPPPSSERSIPRAGERSILWAGGRALCHVSCRYGLKS